MIRSRRPNFSIPNEARDCLERIIIRCRVMIPDCGLTGLDHQMNLAACHNGGCPLDFARLERFPDFDFVHDILGIARHLNKRNGRLMDCFLPKCALPEC